MPKIIFTSRYIKNPANVNAGKLIRYMGTREGVEKLPSTLIVQLAKAIASSCHKRRAKLSSQMDSKLKSKIEQKKQAHGLKTDRSISEYSEEEQGFEMRM